MPFSESIRILEDSRAASVKLVNPDCDECPVEPAAAGTLRLDDSTVWLQDCSASGGKRRRPEECVRAVPKEVSSKSKRSKTEKPAVRKLNNDQWEYMFLRLLAYKQLKGDCLVPKRYVHDPKLGTWVETQRVQYKKLQREYDVSKGVEEVQPNKRLDQTRLAKLNSIGFVWSAKSQRKPTSDVGEQGGLKPHVKAKAKKPPSDDAKVTARSLARSRAADAQWNEMYTRLFNYKKEFGDTLVPRKYDKDPRLANWVENQRVLWNRDFRESLEVMYPLGSSQISFEDSGTASSLDSKAEVAGLHGFNDEPVLKMMDHQYRKGSPSHSIGSCDLVPEEPVCKTDSATQPTVQPVGRHLAAERKEKLDALGFVWSLRTKRIDDHWDEMYRQLVAYRQLHGDCLVPSRYENNLKLGKWVETQRYEYTKLRRVSDVVLVDTTKRNSNPRLTEDRLKRLEAIGFEWKVRNKMKRYYDKQWDQMFDRLLDFKAKHGHCMVPKRFQEDTKLGTWVHTQRIQFRKLNEVGQGQSIDLMAECAAHLQEETGGVDEASHRLTEDRRKRLVDIGFVWSGREGERNFEQSRIARTSYDDQWDAMFALLKDYKEKYGDCLVPKRYAGNPKLGTWVDTQRVQYKKIRKKDGGVEEASSVASTAKSVAGRLTEERIRRLEDLGFVWSLRDDWQKHYNELAEFKSQNGHCNVPARYTPNRRLGIWVSAQRQQYKSLMKVGEDEKRNIRLSHNRIKLLNQLGFTWIIRTRDTPEAWHQKVQELQEFRSEHGHCRVPEEYTRNPDLAEWVKSQRTLYNRYKTSDGPVTSPEAAYSEERIKILEDLGFEWASLSNGEKDADTQAVDIHALDALQAARTLASTMQLMHTEANAANVVPLKAEHYSAV